MSKKSLKKFLLDLLCMLVGTLLVAIGLSTFTVPNDIAPGGVSGLATVLCSVTGLFKVGLWTLLLNVPLILLAWWKLGLRPLLSTMVATVMLSVFIDLWTLTGITYSNDVLLSALFGGIFCGIGMGLLFMRGISTGGTDLLTLILGKVFANASLSSLLLLIDAGVVILATLVFRNIEIGLYSLVTIYVTTKLIDAMLTGADRTKIIYTVTEHGDELRRLLTEEHGLGVTVLEARGGFTGDNKQVLVVATHRSTYTQTLHSIKNADRKAFTLVTSAVEIFGEGFKD